MALKTNVYFQPHFRSIVSKTKGVEPDHSGFLSSVCCSQAHAGSETRRLTRTGGDSVHSIAFTCTHPRPYSLPRPGLLNSTRRAIHITSTAVHSQASTWGLLFAFSVTHCFNMPTINIFLPNNTRPNFLNLSFLYFQILLF